MIDFSTVLSVDTTKTTCIGDARPTEITRRGVTRTILLSEEGWRKHVFGSMLLMHSHPWLTESEIGFLIGACVD